MSGKATILEAIIVAVGVNTKYISYRDRNLPKLLFFPSVTSRKKPTTVGGRISVTLEY